MSRGEQERLRDIKDAIAELDPRSGPAVAVAYPEEFKRHISADKARRDFPVPRMLLIEKICAICNHSTSLA